MTDAVLNISGAIREAILHVREVCRRSHIDSSTPDKRLDLFLTSLRRALGKLDKEIWGRGLLNRCFWTDAGVLRGEHGPYGYSITRSTNLASEELQGAVELAHMMLPDDDELMEDNRQLMQGAKKDLLRMQYVTKEVERIRGEQVKIGQRVEDIYSGKDILNGTGQKLSPGDSLAKHSS